MSANSLVNKIIQLGEKRKTEELHNLISKTSAKELTKALNAKLTRSDCITFWNYLLQGFDSTKNESRERRFTCVKCFLDSILKVELQYKQTYDLVTRLCQDLNTFPSEQLVEVLELCIDGLRLGDPKCVGWKDLLPETLKIIASLSKLSVNGITMSGFEYRDTTVGNLCSMRWPTEVLTPIADMFKDLQLHPAEITTVLNKYAGSLQSLAPAELPALSFQLFSMCSTAAHIIIPIMALEKYFYRFFYKKLFADMNSNTTDFDSIDAFSDKELREAEETILHHLNYCTQYNFNEMQLYLVLKNFLSMPDVVLTPFVLSAVLSMTAANRDPESRLSTSVLLSYLRSVIKNNEHERTLAEYSVWCRDSLQRKQVDLEQVFTVLIDQNKDGKDVITPGLVNLAFVLLKAKNNANLNGLAIDFLTKFIRKRFVFGRGVVKKLAEWMIVEQDQYQFSDCLTHLSVADTFTVSECVKTINYVLDFFLWIPGEQTMRMMSFILPILKISAIVRDAFIEVLRKGMNSAEVKTRRMSVYGFCMILKQLNNSNALRSQLGASGMCTQHSISGFSLMSQATLGNRNNPQRHFDLLTLEIIGVLRSCFNQTLEVKRTLYENLQRAVELNPKLVPHVLQFIDCHFRHYFHTPSETDESAEFAIKFDKIVRATDTQDMEIEVNDNLGRLILFVSHCLVIFEKFEGDYDAREMKRLLNVTVEKIISKDLKFEEMAGNLTNFKNEFISQELNFVEGLMAYTLLSSKQSNDKIKHLLPLFRLHNRLTQNLKTLAGTTKKSHKRPKNANESESTMPNLTINGVAIKKINTEVENIWDLPVVEKLLRLLHEDIVNFAAPNNTSVLRANSEFVRYILEVAASKIEAIRLEPEYKQLTHSRRTLRYLMDITKVVYDRCIKRLPELWRDFDLKTAALAAECFRQCLVTANEVYKKKFADVFVKGFDLFHINNCKESPAMLQDIIDEFMHEDLAAAKTGDSLSKDADARKIPHVLFQCLEILYDNISYCNRITIESYTWLYKFCKEYEVNTKELSLVHKLLFEQRQKTHSGAFFNTIAQHMGKLLGLITESEEEEQSTPEGMCFELKSITLGSFESCLNYLYATLRKQIEDVDYFIIKANNLSYKVRIVSEDDREMSLGALRSLERSICTQLVHISNTLLALTNVCIPLGNCMDSLLKLLMLHYNCLKNLTRHFLSCCLGAQLNIQGTRFDFLLRVVGKPLPSHLYRLITYIEGNILEKEPFKKPNPKAEKAKVLRGTKLIPKTILCVENFNKHVILLSKKSKSRLSNLLHFGTVRDFRFKTADLKAAIERTLSHSSQIEAQISELGDDEQHIAEEALLELMEAESGHQANEEEDTDAEAEADEEHSVPIAQPSTRNSAASAAKLGTRRKIPKNSNSDDDKQRHTPEDVLENESSEESHTQLLKNLAHINKKAKKRSSRESEKDSPDVASAQPEPKKRRGRSAKKYN